MQSRFFFFLPVLLIWKKWVNVEETRQRKDSRRSGVAMLLPFPVWTEPGSSGPSLWTAWSACLQDVWALWWYWELGTVCKEDTWKTTDGIKIWRPAFFERSAHRPPPSTPKHKSNIKTVRLRSFVFGETDLNKVCTLTMVFASAM